jgi:hypothetical protein
VGRGSRVKDTPPFFSICVEHFGHLKGVRKTSKKERKATRNKNRKLKTERREEGILLGVVHEPLQVLRFLICSTHPISNVLTFYTIVRQRTT